MLVGFLHNSGISKSLEIGRSPRMRRTPDWCRLHRWLSRFIPGHAENTIPCRSRRRHRPVHRHAPRTAATEAGFKFCFVWFCLVSICVSVCVCVSVWSHRCDTGPTPVSHGCHVSAPKGLSTETGLHRAAIAFLALSCAFAGRSPRSQVRQSRGSCRFRCCRHF